MTKGRNVNEIAINEDDGEDELADNNPRIPMPTAEDVEDPIKALE